jgi:chromate transporter
VIDGRRATWLWISLKIGCLSFGSVSRTMLFEDELVRQRGWIGAEDFQECLTIAQILPGPNLVNLSACLGYRIFDVPLAAVGVLTLCLPGALLAVLVWNFVPMSNPSIAEFFRGCALGAFMLMGGFLYNLLKGIVASGRVGVKVDARKVLVRYTLMVLIAAAALLAGWPVLGLVAAGVPLCLAAEFALR